MSVVVVGLSHRTAPLELLERMAVPDERLPKALADLVARDFVSEAVVLSTCHRIEVYAVAERFHGAMADVRHFLSELSFVAPEEFSDHLYVHYDDAAAAHLFSVAAGLDSVVLGESQILGQVRDAWERARAEGAAGSRLSQLFRHSLEVGKRARSETAIARGITSLSQAAVAMAGDRLGGLAGRAVVVLGAGEMGAGLVDEVAEASVPGTCVTVANRTRPRAERLAERAGGRAVTLDELPAALAGADLLLTSTGSTSVVLTAAEVKQALAGRPDQPLLIVDLGMPRDVDPAVAALPGVSLLGLADVETFVDASMEERRREVVPVRAIVAEEVDRWVEAVTARFATPTVAALRQRAEDVRLAELARYRNRLADLEPRQREAVEALTRSLLGKLLHDPTVRLKDAAGSAKGDRLAGALRELFDL
ncbi:MAG TPA: glutamyl-tRNA reductase [Acidimicrobiales bacterium]|jgi:glutamyl-tRNA reductase|nr:glutamyl-tRNA reductase [Acidimicrobiales bacterium]